jgi:hypothetical protein
MALAPTIINPYDPRGTTIQTQAIPKMPPPGLTPAQQADWARAQGSAAGAASSLGAATQQGQANSQAGAGAMVGASYQAGMMGPGGRPLTQAEISDMARARGGALGGASSLGAATQQGQYNQQAGAGAMNTASTMAARPASIPYGYPQITPYQGARTPAPGGLFGSPYSTWDNASKYMNPNAALPPMPQAQTNPMMSQNITMDSISPYMNPFMDQIIASGTNAIAHSGAGQGLFGSSGNINDIGTWATNAKAQGINDAVGRMLSDRGYFTDQYWNGRDADTQDYWNKYNANVQASDNAYTRFQGDRGFIANRADTAWNQGMQEKTNDQDMYKYQTNTSLDNTWKQINDYNARMSNKESRDSNLANVGPAAAQNAASLTASQGQALANMATALAEWQAKAAAGGGQMDSGMIEGIVTAITSYLSASKSGG